MRELFAYYRVRTDMLGDASEAVDELQQALREAYPGLQARRLRRPANPATGSDSPTWMETYAWPGRGIDAALEAAIAARARGLAPFIDGARHVEAFEVVGPPAAG